GRVARRRRRDRRRGPAGPAVRGRPLGGALPGSRPRRRAGRGRQRPRRSQRGGGGVNRGLVVLAPLSWEVRAVRRGLTEETTVVRVGAGGPGRHLARNPLAAARAGMVALRTLRRVGPALESWASATGPHRAVLAGPRSFCAGVERAIEIVERALDRHGPPVYVRKQIVHNVHVVRDLERRGAVFVEELDEVPDGSVVVFSAHGVAPAVRADAAR